MSHVSGKWKEIFDENKKDHAKVIKEAKQLLRIAKPSEREMARDLLRYSIARYHIEKASQWQR